MYLQAKVIHLKLLRMTVLKLKTLTSLRAVCLLMVNEIRNKNEQAGG